MKDPEGLRPANILSFVVLIPSPFSAVEVVRHLLRVDQRSDDWLSARGDRLTASTFVSVGGQT